jgi:hypothetical protein
MTPPVAVLVPCSDEQAATEEAATDFQKALPESRNCVYDKNSIGQKIQRTRVAGADILHLISGEKLDIVVAPRILDRPEA